MEGADGESSGRPAPRDGAQNAQVEIDGADRIAPPILPDEGKAKLIDKIKLEIHTSQSIQTVEPKTLSAAELHRLYTDTLIPQHRYLAPSLSEAVNSPEIGPHPAKWLAGISEINLSRVVNAWLNTNRSTEYEELYCIGLDQESGRLTGVLTVKQGGGYSGGPGTAGSREHIAFWVDWGWGFRYEGTASVAVHDFGCLPPAGLEYNVALPVDLLSRMPLGGEGAKTVKVRAVLSWSTPPSTTDPNAPIVWGNRVESRIPIPPTRQARGGNRVPCLAAGATETDQTSSDGRIVDAAIKALTGMDLGLCALPESLDVDQAHGGVDDDRAQRGLRERGQHRAREQQNAEDRGQCGQRIRLSVRPGGQPDGGPAAAAADREAAQRQAAGVRHAEGQEF